MPDLVTLDQAIENWIQNQRRERALAQQRAKEERESRVDDEAKAAEQARVILSKHYSLDLSELSVLAYYDHANQEDNTALYEIQITLSDDQFVSTSDFVPVYPTGALDSQELLVADWTAFHFENISNFDNLIEALVHAKYGTTEPDDIEGSEE